MNVSFECEWLELYSAKVFVNISFSWEINFPEFSICGDGTNNFTTFQVTFKLCKQSVLLMQKNCTNILSRFQSVNFL